MLGGDWRRKWDPPFTEINLRPLRVRHVGALPGLCSPPSRAHFPSTGSSSRPPRRGPAPTQPGQPPYRLKVLSFRRMSMCPRTKGSGRLIRSRRQKCLPASFVIGPSPGRRRQNGRLVWAPRPESACLLLSPRSGNSEGGDAKVAEESKNVETNVASVTTWALSPPPPVGRSHAAKTALTLEKSWKTVRNRP